MATERIAWRPDWVVPPGEFLLEALQERGMSQSELARRMDRPVKTINEIINGKTAITPETAIQLELTLGISARYWTGLETLYRENLARQRVRQELEANTEWAQRFPIQDLEQNGLIKASSEKGGLVAALLSYFAVSSPAAWENQWQASGASFRRSPTFAASPEATAAWLRWGQLQASDAKTLPFDAKRLREVLKELRRLTRQADFVQAVEQTKELLGSAGVVLLVTPEFKGIRLSGAAFWITPDKAVIQLSMRYKTNDQFWFSLFHEAAHLLERARADHVDTERDGDSTDPAEQKADRFARETLVPPGPYAAFRARMNFTQQSISDFAREVGIAAGIVVGRLQRDDLIAPSRFNKMKQSIKWPEFR